MVGKRRGKMSKKTKTGRVVKPKTRKLMIGPTSVVKMLTVMEANQGNPSRDPVTEFLVTGRTGRRNAMADILGPSITTSSGDLPDRLQTLTTQDDSEAGPSTAQGSCSGAASNQPDQTPCSDATGTTAQNSPLNTS